MKNEINSQLSFNMINSLSEIVYKLDHLRLQIYDVDNDFENLENLQIYNNLKRLQTDIYKTQNLIIHNTEKPQK